MILQSAVPDDIVFAFVRDKSAAEKLIELASLKVLSTWSERRTSIIELIASA